MKTRGEAELDAFINRRARENTCLPDRQAEQQHVEALWAESERRHTEKRRRENRAAWYKYHERMREWHARMSREHEAKALALLEGS